jgi:hypothetical protein
LGVEMILGVIEENPIILEDTEFVNHIKNTMIE